MSSRCSRQLQNHTNVWTFRQLYRQTVGSCPSVERISFDSLLLRKSVARELHVSSKSGLMRPLLQVFATLFVVFLVTTGALRCHSPKSVENDDPKSTAHTIACQGEDAVCYKYVEHKGYTTERGCADANAKCIGKDHAEGADGDFYCCSDDLCNGVNNHIVSKATVVGALLLSIFRVLLW
ncbi:hypothetical protein L596_029476 [Steinernema carpocapsae]|uniref:Uncharacterized protein n=1 Tax=Steinernema carpocapsae TaxID=34508 RepID=A0A4U5LUR5_STECR|nr:hypothetical protein L596_029476 [Steinernema carpocapsae]